MIHYSYLIVCFPLTLIFFIYNKYFPYLTTTRHQELIKYMWQFSSSNADIDHGSIWQFYCKTCSSALNWVFANNSKGMLPRKFHCCNLETTTNSYLWASSLLSSPPPTFKHPQVQTTGSGKITNHRHGHLHRQRQHQHHPFVTSHHLPNPATILPAYNPQHQGHRCHPPLPHRTLHLTLLNK